VAELGLAQADDAVLLARARELDRIFVTRDRDSGLKIVEFHP
jgi:predicted nuclease of predicted toxin-antitoxin system